MDPLDAQIRQVFFFDTPDLALNEHGVVVRARRVQGRGDDSVVKLRPVVPTELPAERARVAGLRRRGGRDARGFVCSASMKGSSGRPSVREAMRETGRSASCSRRSSARSTPSMRPRASGSTTCRSSGPIFVLKLKFAPEEFGRKLVAEMWLYPDGSRILELSTKCAPGEAFQVAAEARAFLSEQGVDL